MADFSPTRLNALALLGYAEAQGKSDVYQQVWALVLSGRVAAQNAEPEGLKEVLEQVPPAILKDVLRQFLEMARENMDTLPVEIISAVPLNDEQRYKIELKLIRLLRKQLDVTCTVDASLLGGVRVIVDNTVIDHSIKRRLADMKQAVYKGVNLSDGTLH